ncbi:hypothetical protein AAC387_Pa08g1093 [Persea americana]
MSSELGRSRLSLIEDSLSSRYSSWIRDALDELPDNFLITDPAISGNPIVFASRGFLKMYGYSKEEVLGRNGRIFQGPDIDRRSVSEIREAIRQERPLQLTLLNYRKDGSPIRVFFHMNPVFSRDDWRVIHFVAVQVPISANLSLSRSGSTRNRRNSVEDWSGLKEIVLGSCRREVCLNSVGELGRALPFDSYVDSDNRGLEAEELCEASDVERQKAAAAVNNILSALTHYSELTGKVVCGERCSSMGIAPLSSSLIISLGYSTHEVLGRNCRFLQGPDTDVEALCQIRESIQAAQSCTVCILNYRKNGSSFWNLLHISPVRNASGKIAFYVGVQVEEGSKSDSRGLSPEMMQLGAVGAVKVAVRSLSMGVGPSKS